MRGPDDQTLRGGGDQVPASRIGLRVTEDRFVLETPPRGLHGAAAGQMVGGVLCLALCAEWTGRHFLKDGAATASLSVPFWLLGVGVVLAALQSVLKHHRVDLCVDAGWIRLFPIGWRRPLRPQMLSVRLEYVRRGEADGRGGTEVPVLVLDDRTRVFHLMEGFTEAEQRRVLTELNRWRRDLDRRERKPLSKRPRTRRPETAETQVVKHGGHAAIQQCERVHEQGQLPSDD